MPITNGKYVKPNWTNELPPFIDASAMGDISNTAQKNQSINGDIRLKIDNAPLNVNGIKLNQNTLITNDTENNLLKDFQLTFSSVRDIKPPYYFTEQSGEEYYSHIDDYGNIFVFSKNNNGHNSFYMSEDGATKVEGVLFSEAEYESLNSMPCIAINKYGFGLAGGVQNSSNIPQLRQTRDGGKTWGSVFAPLYGDRLNVREIGINDKSEGVAYCNDSYNLCYMLKIIGGEISTTSVQGVNRYYTCSNLECNNNGYALMFTGFDWGTYAPQCIYSIDGGSQWEEAIVPYLLSDYAYVDKVKLLDNNTFIAKMTDNRTVIVGYIDEFGINLVSGFEPTNGVSDVFANNNIAGFASQYAPQSDHNLTVYKYLKDLTDFQNFKIENVDGNASKIYTTSLTNNGTLLAMHQYADTMANVSTILYPKLESCIIETGIKPIPTT